MTGEWRVVRKDGSIRTVLVTAGRLELDEQVYKITTGYDMRGRSLTPQKDKDPQDALREVNHKVVSILTESINSIKSMSRLYDRLRQAPSVTSIGLKGYLDQNRDTLGMQIVVAIVGQHDGEFSVEDRESSTFLVRLPRMMD